MSTKRNASLLRELSTADARRAERALDQSEKRRSTASAARARELDSAFEDAQRKLRDFLGKKDWLSLRREMREQHIGLRALLQPPAGLGRDPRRLHAVRKRKADQMLKALGIDRRKLNKLAANFQERVQKVSVPALGKLVPGYNTSQNLAKWQGLSDLHSAPLPWGPEPAPGDPNDPHRWFLFRPPFFDWPSRFVQVESSGFQVTGTQYVYGSLGAVGHDVRMILSDSDDHDYASAEVDTRFGFIFDIPADGVIEVLIDALNLAGTHDLTTRDEWGWSETFTAQTNYLSAEVLHPNTHGPALAAMSTLNSTDISTSLHHAGVIPGQHYFAHFVSGPVTAGSSVVILVGTRNWEICGCNDTGYDSSTSFMWAVQSVEVRVR